MCSPQLAAWGIVALVFGPPLAVWPSRAARLSEILDAIGREPSGRVEPADWYVALTRFVGVGLALFGAGFLVLCVLL